MSTPREWFRIRNLAADEAEIDIYDEIGGGWTGDGMSAKRFRNELRDVKAKRLTVRINSPGGDVFDGFAIYNSLRDHEGHVTVKVDGLAASAASVIAMAGDEIRMSRNAFLMIHDAWGMVVGTADDMRAQADAMEKITAKIAEAYAQKSQRPVDEFRAKMKAETWLTAEEAETLNLIDGIDGESQNAPQRVAASLTRFRNVPAALKAAASGAIPMKNDTTTTTTTTTAAPNAPQAAVCTMPDGSTNDMDREMCEAAGGTYGGGSGGDGGDSGGKSPAPGSPSGKRREKPATVADAKAAAPGAPADFILACVEKTMTATEIVAANSERLAAENDSLRAKLNESEKARAAANAVSASSGSAVRTEPPVSDAPVEDDDAALKSEWNANADIRAEFGKFETFKHFRAAAKAGRVRINGRTVAA